MKTNSVEKGWITENQAREIAENFGTPVYAYSQKILEEQADKALNFPNAYGLTVRYAMKANPNNNIIRIFTNKGIRIDASSGYEVLRSIRAGIPPSKILLTSQEIPSDLEQLVGLGVNYNACSLNQLQEYGKLNPCTAVTVRINPGTGSGSTNRTNVGGPSSSFGIWHENFEDILSIAKKYSLEIKRMHTHIGSGSDPKVWQEVARKSLDYAKKLIDAKHDVKILNLGGGFKVARMDDEKGTDLQECGAPIKEAFADFYNTTGKKLRLEIEPGTFLVANAGVLLAKVTDVVSTSSYDFIKINSGMTEVTRPCLYGAQHPIAVIPKNPDEKRGTKKYIVAGHCCESGDILTPAPSNPEELMPREMTEAKIGDIVVIGGAGAYCSGMSTKNYNSFPEAAEVLICNDGKIKGIRERQSLDQIIINELKII